MSLGIAVKCPEGIVLAADSRITRRLRGALDPALAAVVGSSPSADVYVNFDNATKVLSFSEPNTSVGAVVFSQAMLGLCYVSALMPEFEAGLPGGRLSVAHFAKHLSEFFVRQAEQAAPNRYGLTVVVGGFDEHERYGRLFMFTVPEGPGPVEYYAGDFGPIWGGQRDIVSRLLQGYDERVPDVLIDSLKLPADDDARGTIALALAPLLMPIPFESLALQDSVDLATFLIRTTADAQRFTAGLRGVGGLIDVATITRREGLRFVQRKEITYPAEPR